MTTQCDHAGELDAGAECPKDSARGDNREQRRKQGQDACEQRAEREADEDGDERDLDRQPGIELLNHAGAITGGDRRQSRHPDLVVGIGLADRLECPVDGIDLGQNLAGVDVGQPRRHQSRVLVLGNEASRQVLRQQTNVFLHRLDAGVTGLRQPAPQTIKRPHVAETSLLLQHRLCLPDHVERRLVEQVVAAIPLDHDVDGVGTGQLLVELAGRGERLLPIRHLIGQPVARLQRQCAAANSANSTKPIDRVGPGPP